MAGGTGQNQRHCQHTKRGRAGATQHQKASTCEIRPPREKRVFIEYTGKGERDLPSERGSMAEKVENSGLSAQGKRERGTMLCGAKLSPHEKSKTVAKKPVRNSGEMARKRNHADSWSKGKGNKTLMLTHRRQKMAYQFQEKRLC